MATPEETPANCGPSFDDIVAHLGLTEEEAVEWLALHRESFQTPDKPLSLSELFNFGYETEIGAMSDEAYEQLNDALTTGHDWALARWAERMGSAVPLEQRVAAAVELAASWWLPVLAERDAQNAQEIAQLLRTASELSRYPTLSREVLRHARDTRIGLPPSGPPPPYVGHFCAAVMHLLDAMLDPPNYSDLSQAMSFATVAPDGSNRRQEIASIMHPG